MDTAIDNLVKGSLQIQTDVQDFESLYFKVRQKECRIHSDYDVSLLPEVADCHVYANEWKIRKTSAVRLAGYLQKKEKALRIMEVGSGNGWLSAVLASISDVQVIGFDVHSVEVDQAKRVFGHKKNLHFVHGSLNTARLLDLKFDVIVFAASLQYFPSFEKTVKDAFSLLAPQGEIHIIDTHFYRDEQVESARLRTGKYYLSLGLPEMIDHYYHHKIDDFRAFNYKILFNPDVFMNRVSKRRHPFYWIMIKH